MKQQSFWTSVCAALLLITTIGFGIALAAGPAEEDLADGEYKSKTGWVKKGFDVVAVGDMTVKYVNRKQIRFKQEHCPDGYVLVDGGEAGERVIVTQQDHKDPFFSGDVVAHTITAEADLVPVQSEALPPDIRPLVVPPLPPPPAPPGPPAVPKRPDLNYTKDDFKGEYYLNLPIQPLSLTMKRSATLSNGKTYALTPDMDFKTLSMGAKTFEKILLCKKKKCGEEEEGDTGYTGGDFGSSSSENCVESSSSSADWWDSSSSESSFSSESSSWSDSSDSSFSESSSDSSSSSDAYSSAWSSESSSACAWWDWHCNAGSSSSESSSYDWSSSESSSDSSSSSSYDWSSSSVSSESWQSSSF